ncbi:autoinducer 2 ABC transporter substrate-binding protein [Mycolicibacterium parafortuitum]|uniref:ABC sugar transporter, periplasmic ligand binding protein [Nocardioides sp. JS614] n=1 Tax=Mycolicibacterium parafortuitum TaxID=39692 RepID=A0A375YI00_MYCPF|nr:autoinducer 2 ABC transporter substrate-binding protein [Mycolicibacterium parafortuitum]SRX80741.1 ABC sugar transporter, periplasmic ligand binding protein [Nocardioides sp. JS614] [Mycolicibacterium parafortuitum]
MTLIAASAGVANAAPDANGLTMVNVVKVKGLPWFNRMAVGDENFAQRTGVHTSQEGADDTDPQKQVQLIADLIPRRPTAITVVPNSVEALEDVLGQARAQGITVVSHEATGIQNADIDIEAFDNAAFGRQIIQSLAQCMGGQGDYVQFVGSVTMTTHMQWVDAAHDMQLADFPGMTRVESPVETADDESTAYAKATELLAKYPNLRGFQGAASTDVPGIARAVRDAGLQDRICVMGTAVPSLALPYFSDGSVDKIFFWDPAMAGEAALQIALMLVQGEKIEAGTNLNVPGYESLTKLDGYDNVFVGNAALEADANTIAGYQF